MTEPSTSTPDPERMDAAPLDWEGLAKVDARARHFGEERRGEIVRRGGGDPAEQEALGLRARGALREEALAQEAALAALYAGPFAAERRRLAAENPPIESLGELPPPAPVVELVGPAEAATAPEQPAAVAAAEAPSEPPRPAQVEEPPSGTKQVPTYLQKVSEVSGPAAPSPSPPAPAFVAPALVPPPTSIEIRLARLAGVDPDTTQPPIARSEPTLPFLAGVKGEVPPAVRAMAEVDDDQGEEEGTRSGDETAFLPRRLFTEPATPFEKTPAKATAKADAKLSEKEAVEAAETVALDGDAVRAAAAAPEPWISLDEYASFLAELAQDPSRAGVLRAKYGIAGEDAQRALGAGFAARFTREPGLRAKFDEALARERARRR